MFLARLFKGKVTQPPAIDVRTTYLMDNAFSDSLSNAIRIFGETTLDEALKGSDIFQERVERHARILSNAPASHGGRGNALALNDVAVILQLIRECVEIVKKEGGSVETGVPLSRNVPKLNFSVRLNQDGSTRITDKSGSVLNNLPLGEIIGFSNQDHTQEVSYDTASHTPNSTFSDKIALALPSWLRPRQPA